MNFSESAQNEYGNEALAHSLQLWWKDAGVDVDYLRSPGSLLEQSDPPVDETFSEVSRTTTPATSGNSVAEDSAKDSFPETLDAFLQWLKTTPNVPGQDIMTDAVCPYGPANPELMVVVAMPDQNRADSAKLFEPSIELLVKNMLRALEIDPESVFFAALSLARPIQGRIDQSLFPPLNRRMLRLVELVNPKKIIIFGDTATRALCDDELLLARKKKLFINQGSSKTEAIATFHPRILIERPEIKAEAWRDIQPILGTI